MAHVVSEAGVPVVLMHNQEGNDYDDLVPGVIKALERSIEKALKAGVDGKKIIVDPGIGFGKNVRQNLEILRRLNEFTVLRKPLLLGTSRKSTIGYVLNLEADQRVEGTAATVALSIAGGADIVRVHDVNEMVRVAKMSDAIVRGWTKF
jgi:dihydropteroate synthase